MARHTPQNGAAFLAYQHTSAAAARQNTRLDLRPRHRKEPIEGLPGVPRHLKNTAAANRGNAFKLNA